MKLKFWNKLVLFLLVGLPLLYIFLGFFVAPVVLKKLLQTKISDTLGHRIAVDKIKINPLEFTLDLQNLSINDPAASPVLSLKRLYVDFEFSSLFLDTRVVSDVIIEQPWINMVLDADGVLNLSRLAPETEKPPSAEPAKPQPILIESMAVHEASVAFEDLSRDTPVKHIFEPINIELENVSTKINALGLSEISILTQDQEKVLIESQFSFEPLHLQSVIAISNVNLRRVNQHLGEPVPVNIQEGRFGVTGRLGIDHGPDQPLQMQFQGGLDISQLALVDSTLQPVLGFQNLLIPSINFSLLEQRIVLERIELNGLTMETGLNEQGQLSLLPANKAPDPTAHQPTEANSGSDAKEWHFTLREFTINDATFKIDDRSIQPPVHMELSELAARFENITNNKDNTTLFQLDTTVNNTAHFHAEGNTKPFADTADLDLRLALEDYDLIQVSPYAGKFIGYEIDRGLLGLNAAYHLQGTTLTAEHDILFSNFTLGAGVESPDAIKAPIKLGLSLLEDSQQRIKLNLPVEGDLANPEFSLGSVIRKSFANVITKLVSSPFSILASIAGVKGEDLDSVGFFPGTSLLTEHEQKKLINISQALKDRPRLALTIHPSVDKKADLSALKTSRFDSEVEQLTKGKSHGHDPKILKKLYKQRIGSQEYAQKLDDFREKNQDAPNPEALFVAEIRQDLIERQPLDQAALDKLAELRGQSIQNFLLNKSEIDPARTIIGKQKTTEVTADGIVHNNFSITSK